MSTGRLRVYLGSAPGVGKTYSMLEEAHRRKARGTDIVIGFVETHGRAHTEELTRGLEAVRRAIILDEGIAVGEMDVDAILRRNPQAVLVDDLGHSNVPGSRHTKRWQDVQLLLDAGIDVISAVNVEQLESLNGVVESITGIHQPETVPDSFVRAADQIELKDMAPEALRRRLAHGNVLAPDQLDAALGNYFRIGNLAALRELVLLWLADRVDEGLEQYRREHGVSQTWATRQRVVVALTGGPEGETLLRRGATVADRGPGRSLVAVHVVKSDGALGVHAGLLEQQRQLTEQLGGEFHTVIGEDVAAALLDFARSVNGTRLVVGESRRGRLSTALRPSTAESVVRNGADIDVQVVTHERASRSLLAPALKRTVTTKRRFLGIVMALALPAIIAALLLPIQAPDDTEISLVLLAMLAGVVVCSVIGGMLSAALASLWSTVLTNYWFIPPENTLVITQPQNFVALLMFIVIGCSVAAIVDRSSALAAKAAALQAEGEALDALSREVLQRSSNLVVGMLELVCTTFGMRAAVLFERRDDGLLDDVIESAGTNPPAQPDDADVSVDAGRGLSLAVCGRALTTSERRILAAYAAQAGALLERDRLTARAADASRLRADENARRALLGAVSHDLRTPIAGVKAAISTLADDQLDLAPEDRAALLESAERGTDRLSLLVTNLLDMNRLQTGSVVPLIRPVILDEIVQHIIAGLTDPATVTSEIREDLLVIDTDPGLLERVLANVIENASRQDSGGRPVRITAGAVGVPASRVDIRIADRGPGVRHGELETMFEPFRQAGDRKQASADGVGLGLAVAAGLMELLGGSIEAEETPGGGLTMVVSVPLRTEIS